MNKMTGTLRAALVPEDVGSSMYSEAVELLDAHSGTYPVKGEIQVRMIIPTIAMVQTSPEILGLYNNIVVVIGRILNVLWPRKREEGDK